MNKKLRISWKLVVGIVVLLGVTSIYAYLSFDSGTWKINQSVFSVVELETSNDSYYVVEDNPDHFWMIAKYDDDLLKLDTTQSYILNYFSKEGYQFAGAHGYNLRFTKENGVLWVGGNRYLSGKYIIYSVSNQ